ncbi:hypothetical protein J6TS2_25170 [Heyndrickxia sporothermodurans]|nr:hypothetical protein J6TS2_25170 [Heyndrickxia sporothermodurans]
MQKAQKNKKRGFFKDIIIEIRDSIIFEVIWVILTYIPKLIFRLIRYLH